MLYALIGVTKRYGSTVTAVDEVDFAIDQGEFVVVAGPSGSGKTTLLQLLGALDRPTSGRVVFEGRSLAEMSDGELADLRRDRIGFVFQQFNLIPTLSALENVEAAMAPRPNGMSRRMRRSEATDLLERVGLGGRVSHLPSQLSGGEQQRVAIARALANGPDVLLADEPTGNLDSATGEEIVDLLRELWSDGLSVILITHDLDVAATAPRVIRMQDGKLSQPGLPTSP
jgi:putative ABC transport system ATP-binding protein